MIIFYAVNTWLLSISIVERPLCFFQNFLDCFLTAKNLEEQLFVIWFIKFIEAIKGLNIAATNLKFEVKDRKHIEDNFICVIGKISIPVLTSKFEKMHYHSLPIIKFSVEEFLSQHIVMKRLLIKFHQITHNVY